MDGGNQNDGRVASETSSAAAINQQYHALLTAASETAGSNTWKTFSGRLDGPDEFVCSDAWRYFKNSISRKFVKNNVKKKGDVCPVCMEDPTSSGIEAEGGQLSRNGWHVTKACNHAVCRECLQNYANSLIADPTHSGPLKCPCCPRLLTREDAKVALSNPYLYHKKKKMLGLGSISELSSYDDEIQQNALELLAKWDKKVRDENLRSMTDFRPCPHCSNATNNDGLDVLSELGSNEAPNSRSPQIDRVGGGFVTPECLAPINEEREHRATRLINWAGTPTSKVVLFIFFLYYWSNTHQLSNQEISNTLDHASQRWNAMKQIFATIVPGLFLPVLPHTIRLLLAKIARNIVEKPIVVTCPCCDKEFNLNASAEFEHNNSTSSNSESASQQWKNEHTRPCPSCSSPIMKDGGCNHVTCGKCKVNFCWACMRTRTSCKSYQCVNGAPYGNAFGDGSLMAVAAGLAAGEREGRTLMEHIEHVEMEARRNLGNIPLAPYLAALFMIHLVLWVLSLLPRNFFVLLLLLFASRVISNSSRVGTPRQGNENRALNETTQNLFLQANNDGRARRTILATGRNRQRSVTSDFRTEGEMVAEAIARSLVEQ